MYLLESQRNSETRRTLRLTPLHIAPRPETLTETPTCRAISAQKETQSSPSETSISEITPVIPSTQPESQFVPPTSVEKGNEREEEGGERETKGDEGVDSAGNVNEGDSESGEKEIIENMGSGDRGSEGIVDDIGGGSQNEDVEGDIPVDNVEDGAESKGNVEEEILEELEADEREKEIVHEDDVGDGETDKVDMDVDGSELSDRPELVEGTKFIVVPDEGPEAEDTPATARENRRIARRSKKLEGTRTSIRRLHLIDSDSEGKDIPQTEETPVETGEESPQAQEKLAEAEEFSPEAEEEHYAKEHK